MSLKHGLLGFLSGQELSGYDLEKLFSNSIGFFWSAKISQVYRDLHTMEKAGWVQSQQVVQTGRPNKKVFRVTDAGREELENWLIHYDMKHDFDIRASILVRMFFAAKRPKEETIALLERFRETCQKTIDKLDGVHEKLECYDIEAMDLLYTKSTLSYGEKYYNMQIAWCTETIEKLQSVHENKECDIQ